MKLLDLDEELGVYTPTSNITDYVDHGLALVAIPHGSKGPNENGWNLRQKAITTADQAAKLTGNVGIAHAFCTPSPTAALDIDDMVLAKPWLRTRGVDLDALLNAHDAVQIVSGKKNRAKLLYRLPDGAAPIRTFQGKEPGTRAMILEFRCAASNGLTMQDVLPPSIHPETGTPYRWGGKGDWRSLPEIPAELLDIWLEQLKSPERLSAASNVAAPSITLDPATVQHLRSALFHIKADDRALWINTGMALKPLGDVGRGMWVDWSLTSKKGDPLEVSETWETFKPTTIDYRFVFAEAQRQGWTNPAASYPSPSPSISDSSGWPEPQPLPLGLLPVKSLDPAHLPEAIRNGVIDIAERLSCPIDFVVAPLLIGAGALIGNRIGILPKRHDDTWEVYPVFWGGIVGPPGSMKTPALEQALKPLRHIEEQDILAHAAKASQYELDKKRYDKELVAFKAGKSSAIPVEPAEPKKPRLIVNDTTYEALGVILNANPRGVFVVGDELSGLLQRLDTPGQEGARGFYLSGWGGNGSYAFDRIGRGTVHLQNYALSIFGGFQPDKIKQYVRATQTGSSQNDGLLQRFQLLVWPDIDRKFALVDRVPDQAEILRLNTAIIALRGLATNLSTGGVTNARGARLLHFDDDAQALFNGWYVANETLVRKDSLGSAQQSHFAKYRSLIPGLALLFHLLEGHRGPVCLDCTKNALQYALYLMSHAKRLYGAVHRPDEDALRALAVKLTNGELLSGFTCRSIYTKGWKNLGDKGPVEQALDRLTELGWLKEGVIETGGRKTVAYTISPSIHKELL